MNWTSGAWGLRDSLVSPGYRVAAGVAENCENESRARFRSTGARSGASRSGKISGRGVSAVNRVVVSPAPRSDRHFPWPVVLGAIVGRDPTPHRSCTGSAGGRPISSNSVLRVRQSGRVKYLRPDRGGPFATCVLPDCRMRVRCWQQSTDLQAELSQGTPV
jgi:hypothetical protein